MSMRARDIQPDPAQRLLRCMNTYTNALGPLEHLDAGLYT